MNQQALDLRRFIQILRRRKGLMIFLVILGILGGGSYAWFKPPILTSTALVLLPQSAQAAQGAAAAANGGANPYTATQEVIATSNHVLSDALPAVRPAMSLTKLRSVVHVGSPTGYIISISVSSKVGADAQATANAVATSYVDYIISAGKAVGHVPAQFLEPATTATGPSRTSLIVVYCLLGAIFGAIVGAIISVLVTRADRRLRERDEIASSIGIPVLASFPVGHPGDAAGWTKLLEDYKPGALHALQLRRALQQLEAANADVNYGRWSFAVLSLSTDPAAIALGPQIAVFAAAQGIPTALVIGPQQDADVTATLQTACAVPASASSKRPSSLQVVVSDGDTDVRPTATLTVVVMVVDPRSPQIPSTMRTTATVLGVSAGVATAEQLARVAVSATSDGRDIAGILVADPDPADQTTGRLPQLARRGQHRKMPTRISGITTEIRK
jgi:capsular polysaccharide biosynthesis protein